jgi:hypothetical protein
LPRAVASDSRCRSRGARPRSLGRARCWHREDATWWSWARPIPVSVSHVTACETYRTLVCAGFAEARRERARPLIFGQRVTRPVESHTAGAAIVSCSRLDGHKVDAIRGNVAPVTAWGETGAVSTIPTAAPVPTSLAPSFVPSFDSPGALMRCRNGGY